jgi:putative ubiquitin-RnfH superfamily antitoxin RatB of RatAB toxin-antitoxin module
MIRVQVVYALPLQQEVCTVAVPDGATVAQAIALSSLAQRDLSQHTVAIFGRPVTLDTPVHEHDRIEILRALRVDPKDARRRRQAHRAGGRRSG